MRISVIVTTYNRPDALAAVLRGLAGQTDRDFETVVADDG
jgi:glycosyltransferase involved in cell wall biosynthesis